MLTAWWQQGVARLQASFQQIGSPHMIILHGFGAGFGLPEISPFVTKTEVQLNMAGLAYRKEKAMPPSSPKGQLPYIEDDGERIADSTFIRAHIEGKYGFDFDAPLNLQQRAQAWAFERMIEHHVYWALVGARGAKHSESAPNSVLPRTPPGAASAATPRTRTSTWQPARCLRCQSSSGTS